MREMQEAGGGGEKIECGKGRRGEDEAAEKMETERLEG